MFPFPLKSYPSTIALIAFGVLVGVCILWQQWWVALAMMVPASGYVIWRREETGVLIIIILTASVIYEEQLPSVPTPVGNLHLVDIFFWLLLAILIIKHHRIYEQWLHRTRLDLPLIAFWLIALGAVVLAVTRKGVPVRAALSEFRIVTYYLLFFMMTHLPHRMRLLKRLTVGLYAIAALVVFFMIVQVMVGHAMVLIPARVESLATMGRTYSNTIRVIPPGNTLIFVMLMVSVAEVIIHRVTLLRVIVAGLLLCGLIIGFNRNLWLPAMMMVGLMFLVGRSQHRIKLMAAGLVFLFVASTTVTYANIQNGRLKAYIDSSWDRLWSLTRGRELFTKGTLIDRVIENRLAKEQIIAHPFEGIGLGNNYRDDVDWNPKLNAYIHNGYLWILMKVGLVGFIPFMWMMVWGAWRGLANWHRIAAPYWQSIVLGFTMAHLGMMLSAFVNPVFMQWHSTPLIGLVLGGNEMILSLTRKNVKDGGRD